jgi:hypothetical protein
VILLVEADGTLVWIVHSMDELVAWALADQGGRHRIAH